jgi:hypothetical protein
LDNITTVRILDEDTCTFEVQSSDFTKRYFKAMNENECTEWVSAIRSAVKVKAKSKNISRRKSVFNSDNQKFLDDESGLTQSNQVNVILVALKSSSRKVETVICRNPEFSRIIIVPNVENGDEILITTSNGGSVVLSYNVLQDKAYDGVEFESGIKNVPLASSLRLRVIDDQFTKNQNATDTSASKKKWVIVEQLNTLFALISINESISMESLLLSCMVLIVTLRSVMLHTPPYTLYLWILLSAFLSVHSIYMVN